MSDQTMTDNKYKNITGAYFIGNMGNGGQERQLFYLVQYLSKSSQVLIFLWENTDERKYIDILEQNSNVILHYLSKKSIYQKIRESRKIIRELEIPYLHSYSFPFNSMVWLLCLGLKCKSIGGIRSRLVSCKKYNGSLKYYAALLLPRRRISNNYRCSLGIGKIDTVLLSIMTKTYYAHNGIDIALFSPNKKHKINCKKVYNSISVGRLFPQKNIYQIVDWISVMKEKGYNLYHEHAGDGPEFDKLKDYIEQKGVKSNFHFAGEILDMPSFMNAADILVHASRYEGCPNVLMEAMSCGLPVLTSNAGDSALIVDHGENGFVYDIDNLEMMVEYGENLFSDHDQLIKFGINGRKKAEREFDINQSAVDICELYVSMGISYNNV